ncbi:unnamed protein product [Cuscuta campestris]|uniref:DYW domain-containing protein n=1 Tax=Cuscuta campestris TaxID=132261 RepID=A0A484KY67_9ASTE|nr:unnamed protein product [Cuscuta campestris]
MNPSKHLKLFRECINSGDLSHARKLLDKIPDSDLRSWTILISAHTKRGHPKEAIRVYDELLVRNVRPDRWALLSVAQACGFARDLRKAKEIHEDAIRFGFRSELVIGNALIDMYGKCRHSEGARMVFDDLAVKKDVISWTAMCSCYMKCGVPREAIQIFRRMMLSGVSPNSLTLSSVLPACSRLKYLALGREIHGHVIRKGMGDNVFISSALVDMYASCSRIMKAELVFLSMRKRDDVLWNVVLSAYLSHGECEKAMRLFSQMRNELGVALNQDTWNAVISGFAQCGETKKSFELLAEMQKSGTKPNLITITAVVPICTNLGSLKAGKEIHCFVFHHGFLNDITSATALVFLYAKCGSLELSRRTFDLMLGKDTVAYNTMIFANSIHGNGEEAVLLFNEMISSGLQPNTATFTAVLSGCSHSRLVDEGQMIFHSMAKDHGVEPDEQHYSCLVDVLSRAGRLEEAYCFIKEMPMEPSATAWGALLAGCKVYKNVRLGQVAANQLFLVEPENPANYVMLSNIFEASKLREAGLKTRELMRDRGITKTPGCSWVQVKNKTHTFVSGDKTHVESEKIYRFLEEIQEKMRMAGRLPHTDYVLQDLDTEEKELSLCHHSEKLAVAYGILNLKGVSTLTVFKNLRICGDCHDTIKFIAESSGVRIVVRDSLRFHHFKEDGLCSCNDFW